MNILYSERGDNMESELLKMATTQGIWSFLSIFLIFYIFRSQQKRDEIHEQRERNYQNIISYLTEKLVGIEEKRTEEK